MRSASPTLRTIITTANSVARISVGLLLGAISRVPRPVSYATTCPWGENMQPFGEACPCNAIIARKIFDGSLSFGEIEQRESISDTDTEFAWRRCAACRD